MDAIRTLVDLFGPENVFILSKAGHKMQQASVRMLGASDFYARTGLLPQHVVRPLAFSTHHSALAAGCAQPDTHIFTCTFSLSRYLFSLSLTSHALSLDQVFCLKRSGGSPVQCGSFFEPVPKPESSHSDQPSAFQGFGALHRGAVCAKGDVGKGVVATKLRLTHLIDDRWDCHKSFYDEGHLGTAKNAKGGLLHFGAPPGSDQATKAADFVAKDKRYAAVWRSCPNGWADVLSCFPQPPAGGCDEHTAVSQVNGGAAAAAFPDTPPSQGQVVPIADSLERAGFQSHSPLVWGHGEHGITVVLADDGGVATVDVDGINSDTVRDFVALALINRVAFGSKLVEWVVAQTQADAPGIVDVAGGGGGGGGAVGATASTASAGATTGSPRLPRHLRDSGLPSAAELGVDSTRQLIIFTWGFRVVKKGALPTGAEASQQTYDARVLTARKHGVTDLAKMNGLNHTLQRVLSEDYLFPGFLQKLVRDIEANGYSAISIACAQGQHRSVAAAEIVKALYYPLAEVHHITMRARDSAL